MEKIGAMNKIAGRIVKFEKMEGKLNFQNIWKN